MRMATAVYLCDAQTFPSGQRSNTTLSPHRRDSTCVLRELCQYRTGTGVVNVAQAMAGKQEQDDWRKFSSNHPFLNSIESSQLEAHARNPLPARTLTQGGNSAQLWWLTLTEQHAAYDGDGVFTCRWVRLFRWQATKRRRWLGQKCLCQCHHYWRRLWVWIWLRIWLWRCAWVWIWFCGCTQCNGRRRRRTGFSWRCHSRHVGTNSPYGRDSVGAAYR